MEIEVFEIVKEFQAFIPQLDYRIYAKILKLKEKDGREIFIGILSHFSKFTIHDAEVYKPSFTFYQIEKLEDEIMKYIKDFKSIDVEVNQYY